MSIPNALTRIVAIQNGMSITSPRPMSVVRAYRHFPPPRKTIDAAPAWFNVWTLRNVRRHIDLRIQNYTVQMQLVVEDADLDYAAELATNFMPVVVDAFDEDVTLAGNATKTDLRGGADTLGLVEYGGKEYMALDLFLDIEIKEAKEFS